MSKPTKEQLREWQQKNRDAHRPPPSPEEARRELGWDMEKAHQEQKNKNSRCNS